MLAQSHLIGASMGWRAHSCVPCWQSCQHRNRSHECERGTRGRVRHKCATGSYGRITDRARDAKLGRDVALKLLPDEFAEDADRMARFEREAQVQASLRWSLPPARCQYEMQLTSRRASRTGTCCTTCRPSRPAA
jgi:hypothetical protein